MDWNWLFIVASVREVGEPKQAFDIEDVVRSPVPQNRKRSPLERVTNFRFAPSRAKDFGLRVANAVDQLREVPNCKESPEARMTLSAPPLVLTNLTGFEFRNCTCGA